MNEQDDVFSQGDWPSDAQRIRLQTKEIITGEAHMRITCDGEDLTTEQWRQRLVSLHPDFSKWEPTNASRYLQFLRQHTKNGDTLSIRYVRNADLKDGPPPPLSTDRIEAFIDWLPVPKTRKLVKKLVADQVAHIRALEAAGKTRAARWQLCATWWLVMRAATRHTFSGVASAVRKIAG